MAWVTPPAYAPDDADLAVLAQILAGGKNSRLYKRLVYELQIADDVSAFNSNDRLASQFRITATARAGHSLAELETIVLEELEKLRSTPPEESELSRVRNQLEVGFYERLESVDSKADQLNEYLFYTGEPDSFQRDLERLRSITISSLHAVAEQHLAPQRRVVLSIVPEGGTTLGVPESRLISRDNLAQSPRAR
jgi:zinc protease